METRKLAAKSLSILSVFAKHIGKMKEAIDIKNVIQNIGSEPEIKNIFIEAEKQIHGIFDPMITIGMAIVVIVVGYFIYRFFS